MVAKHGPIQEFGAGCGYWAAILKKRGVDILACERDPKAESNEFILRDADPDVVIQGDPFDHLTDDRALMLIWPYSDESTHKGDGLAWDAEMLMNYQGSKVIYVGDWPSQGVGVSAPKCCSESFLDILESEWKIVEHVELPCWPQTPNDLFVLERIQVNKQRKLSQ